MTRQPLSGLVLRQYDDHAWSVHGRTTDVLLGQVIGAAGDWKAYTAFSDTPHTGRTRTEALRAAWPDLTPPREPMEPPVIATTRCARAVRPVDGLAVPAPHFR